MHWSAGIKGSLMQVASFPQSFLLRQRLAPEKKTSNNHNHKSDLKHRAISGTVILYLSENRMMIMIMITITITITIMIMITIITKQ